MVGFLLQTALSRTRVAIAVAVAIIGLPMPAVGQPASSKAGMTIEQYRVAPLNLEGPFAKYNRIAAGPVTPGPWLGTLQFRLPDGSYMAFDGCDESHHCRSAIFYKPLGLKGPAEANKAIVASSEYNQKHFQMFAYLMIIEGPTPGQYVLVQPANFSGDGAAVQMRGAYFFWLLAIENLRAELHVPAD